MFKKLFSLAFLLAIFQVASAQSPLYYNPSSGKISLFLDGTLRHIADMPTFFSLYSGDINALGTTKYTDESTLTMKIGPAVAAGAGLYQVTGKEEVYLLDDMGTGNWVYRHIQTHEVFTKYGFDWKLVKKIAALDKPVGIPVRFAAASLPCQKPLHYQASTGRISLYIDGVLRDFPDMPTFLSLYSGDINALGTTKYADVASLSYKVGTPLPKGAGLYQVTGKEEVYLLDDMGTGKMVYRHIPYDVFVACGLDWKLVKKIASLDKPVGAPILKF